MARNTVTAYRCTNCLAENDRGYCYQCRLRMERFQREKQKVTQGYTINSYFLTRGSGGFILKGEDGQNYKVYITDLFKYLDGINLGEITLEETKKGDARGWKPIK